MKTHPHPLSTDDKRRVRGRRAEPRGKGEHPGVTPILAREGDHHNPCGRRDERA